MSILETFDMSVAYPSSVAVRSLSLRAETGEVTGILGANGAGKTSTLMGILGMIAGTNGRIVFDGQDISSWTTIRRVRTGLSLCPQNRRLFPGLSIEENLLMGAYGIRRAQVREQLESTYERRPWLASRRTEAAGRLSGGQQQSVAIARALMSNPRLLMLDEPSSGLSPVAVQAVGEELREIAESGVSVLLVEQDVTLVRELCSRAYVLGNGVVVAEGAIESLVSDDVLSAAYLG